MVWFPQEWSLLYDKLLESLFSSKGFVLISVQGFYTSLYRHELKQSFAILELLPGQTGYEQKIDGCTTFPIVLSIDVSYTTLWSLFTKSFNSVLLSSIDEGFGNLGGLWFSTSSGMLTKYKQNPVSLKASLPSSHSSHKCVCYLSLLKCFMSRKLFLAVCEKGKTGQLNLNKTAELIHFLKVKI